MFSLLGLGACGYQPPINSASYLIEDAAQTLERFAQHPELRLYKEYLTDARAVIVVPKVPEHGIASGFRVGPGVFVARATDGTWSDPSMHHLISSHHTGFVYGEHRALVMIVRTGPAFESILETDGRIGKDYGSPLGVVGAVNHVSPIDDAEIEVLVFADHNVADYLDDNLHGSQLVPDAELNEGLYGRGAKRLSIFKDVYGEPATNHHPGITRRLQRALGS